MYVVYTISREMFRSPDSKFKVKIPEKRNDARLM